MARGDATLRSDLGPDDGNLSGSQLIYAAGREVAGFRDGRIISRRRNRAA